MTHDDGAAGAELDLEPIKTREALATKGPWRCAMSGYSVKSTDDDMPIVAAIPGEASTAFYHGDGAKGKKWLDNSDFIASAREDIPALIAEVVRLRSALRAPQELHRECHDLVCNGDRAYPRGEKGHSCSCNSRALRAPQLDAETEKALREYLWLGHGHHGVYGDDGEMQCGQCAPMWDYRRAPLADVVRQAIKARQEVNLAALRAPQPQEAKTHKYEPDVYIGSPCKVCRLEPNHHSHHTVAALRAPQDEIELRLDDDALAMLTAIVRQYRLKMQPGAPANVLIDVVQEGLDRLMLQTIKGTRSPLRAALRAPQPQEAEAVAIKTAFDTWFKRICAEDINPASLLKESGLARESFHEGWLSAVAALRAPQEGKEPTDVE